MSVRAFLTSIVVCLSALAAASWPTILDGPNHRSDNGTAVAVDTKGNVFVLATVEESSSNTDLLIAKYGKSGALAWSTVFGDSTKNDSSRFLVVDSHGGAIVASSYTAGSINKTNLRKFTPSGGLSWSQDFIAPTGSSCAPGSILTTPEDSVVVGMNAANSTSNYVITAEYSATGNLSWSDIYTGEGGFDVTNGSAVNADGDIFVTGAFYNNGNGFDIGTIKYSSAGNREWVKKLDGNGRDDSGLTAAVDSIGNVVIAASSFGPSATVDFLTVKYSPSGQKLWEARAGSTVYSDAPRKVRVDQVDNVVVAGISGQFGGDFLTVKYASDGTKLWQKSYTADGNVVGLDIDEVGNVLVGGSSKASVSGDVQFVLLKYNAEGKRIFVNSQTRTSGFDSVASAMSRDSVTGRIYLTGNGSDATGQDIFTARF